MESRSPPAKKPLPGPGKLSARVISSLQAACFRQRPCGCPPTISDSALVLGRWPKGYAVCRRRGYDLVRPVAILDGGDFDKGIRPQASPAISAPAPCNERDDSRSARPARSAGCPRPPALPSLAFNQALQRRQNLRGRHAVLRRRRVVDMTRSAGPAPAGR